MGKSLQDITSAWGFWMSGQHPDGHGVKFTESTNYANRSELSQYYQYQTNATYQSINYDPYAPSPIPGQVSSVVTSYNNASSIQQSYTYQQSISTQQSFNWSITESLSISRDISAGITIPDVAQVGGKVTTSLSLSSTQGSTKTTTQTWSVTQPIIAPPESHIDATMVVTTQDYNIKWTATCSLIGYVAIWFNNKVALNPNDYHWLWFIPIQNVFSQCIQNNIIDTTGYQIGGNGVLAYASGVFTGNQGVGVCINVKQSPLNSSENKIVSHEIPINHKGVNSIFGVS